MPKPLKRPVAAVTAKKPVKPVEDGRHEKAFEVYRDMGPGRSFRKLAAALKLCWPANPVAYSTLAGWAQKQGWSKRSEEYERGLRHAQTAAPAVTTLLEGDEVDALEKAASQALATVLRATAVAVTKPGDLKALVDTASKALELADRLKQARTGAATAQEVADFGRKLLDRIAAARRRDIDVVIMAASKAACQAAGITNDVEVAQVVKVAVAEVGLRVKEDGQIEMPQETGS